MAHHHHLLNLDPKATQLSTCVLDVFTPQKYAGNPLAVVFIPANLSPSISQPVKQRIAREFNLSETIFIHIPQDAASAATSCRIDIFTVSEELPFAGHPIIGAAAVVLNHLAWGKIEALELKAGRFPIRRISPSPPPLQKGEESSSSLSDMTTNENDTMTAGLVEVDVVHDMHIHSRTLADVVAASDAITAKLSDNDVVRRAELDAPVVSIVKGMTALLVQLPSLEHLAMVSTAQRLEFDEGIQEILLDQGPWGRSFCYRYYYVHQGVDREEGVEGTVATMVHRIRARMVELATEDPATGSAACTLGAYLATTTTTPTAGGDGGVPGMNRFEIVQGVEMGRRSDVVVKVQTKMREGREGISIDSVALSGTAVVTSTGSIYV